MKELEKYISPFTEQLFPSFYQEEGPLYVAFVKAYYEWMETNNETLYHARRLPDYRDIDKVIDDFIVFFKTKYLADIQFTTASNKQLFIKNALNFYRSKGTERSVDLYFKLIHGLQARVYYPADDLFRLSDNEWVDIKYLEIEETPGNVNLVGKTIFGTISGASAFVERLVRIKNGTRFVNVLYIASLNGDFQVNESIYLPNVTNTYLPKIIGSLTELSILAGGSNFAVGEEINITGGSGKSAKAIVSSVNNVVGGVTFTLYDGGFGYSNTSEILISEKVILSNNVTNEVGSEQYFIQPLQQFETLTENLAQITYSGANTFTDTDTVKAYTNNVVTFEGKILTGNSTVLTVNYTTGSTPLTNTDVIYTEANAISANVDGYADVSASANVIASDANSTIEYTMNTASTWLSDGDVVYQYKDGMIYANATVLSAFANTANLTQHFIRVQAIEGAFRTNDVFYKANTSTVPNISIDPKYNLVKQINTTFGVINITGTFIAGGNAYGSNTGNEITIQTVYGYDTASAFSITNYDDLYYLGDVYANDVIGDFANVIIGANAYGMSGDANAGYANVISDVLAMSNVTIGSIDSIVLINPGQAYSYDPYVVINEPIVTHYDKYDLIIEHTGGNYRVGERIVGNSSGAIGKVIVRDSVTDDLTVVRMSINEEFTMGETFSGQETNITSTITGVYERRKAPRTGLNANIAGDAVTANGTIESLRIIDSGFGYFDGELVIMSSSNDSTKIGTGRTSIQKQGIGEGYFRNRRSFTSSDKYLHDGDFYQEYSYQVLTALPFEKYKETLRKVLHVAGTKSFGGYVATNEAQVTITSNCSITVI